MLATDQKAVHGGLLFVSFAVDDPQRRRPQQLLLRRPQQRSGHRPNPSQFLHTLTFFPCLESAIGEMAVQISHYGEMRPAQEPKS